MAPVWQKGLILIQERHTRETFEVRKIKGISEELMIAVGNEDGFYVYAADERRLQIR